VSELTFWYGLSFRDIAETPVKVLFNYIENLEAHKAEKSVLLAEVESLPHSNKGSSQRIVSAWKRAIKNTFGNFHQQRAKSPESHKSMLGMRGISVKIVKPKETKE